MFSIFADSAFDARVFSNCYIIKLESAIENIIMPHHLFLNPPSEPFARANDKENCERKMNFSFSQQLNVLWPKSNPLFETNHFSKDFLILSFRGMARLSATA